jgi:exodeoxyribonuclease V alpha subunit
MLFKFKEYELTQNDCVKLTDKYHHIDIIEKTLKETPYFVLIDVCNRNFEKTDELVAKLFPNMRSTEERKIYASEWILKKNEYTCSSRMLYNDFKSELEAYDPYLCINIDEIITQNSIKFHYENNWIGLTNTWVAECGIAQFVKEKLKQNNILDCDWSKYKKVDEFELTNTQLNSIKNLCKYSISLLVGYSGSGKSSCLKAITNFCEQEGLTYKIACPTAKASLRVEEVTNRKSQTIHRLCLREKEINCDVLCVDETSMVDLSTFNMLINCIENPNCRIVLIGDNAQLNPVGLCCVFDDMIKSNKIPITMLTEIFRYTDKGSTYVATNIRNGKSFLDGFNTQSLSDKYKFIQTNDIQNTLIDEYKKLLNNGINPNDILCLSPMKVYDEGCWVLNSLLQDIVNPLKINQKQLAVKNVYKNRTYITNFRVGDNVLCKKNDYNALSYDDYIKLKNMELNSSYKSDISVFNGQSGIVRNIIDDGLVIQFDNDMIYYNKNKLREIVLNYIITVHSSQGSQAPYVISITSPNHIDMLNKQLCYVSSTRTSNVHIEIGDIRTMNKAIMIDSVKMRNTWLYDELVKE